MENWKSVINKGVISLSDDLVITSGYTFDQFRATRYYKGQKPERVFWLDEKFMFQLIRAAFGQRRKTLLNSLSHGAGLQKDAVLRALDKMSLPATVRGEALTLEQFARLSDLLQP